ncbi:sortilin-related receptor-like [Saccoglossus kowalevskii]|uniref:Uncharacterized protein LOC102805355 n=1 Tax=Saccoglossus kowalevskii TaxID=10224 RepID=A0ABM0MMJ1_SACKO|nr:PREDICTED: uncharacterized protein LOC102805355 [Saccoglossus kowalevskii]
MGFFGVGASEVLSSDSLSAHQRTLDPRADGPVPGCAESRYVGYLALHIALLAGAVIVESFAEGRGQGGDDPIGSSQPSGENATALQTPSQEVFDLTTSTPTRAPCDIGEWRCLDGDRCIDINHRCDIIVDCLDLSDETGCPSRNFTIEYVDAYALSYDTVLVSWGAPRTTPTFDFQYIVYWREAGVATDDSFMNVSSTRTSQRVTHLKAGLIYEFTVAIKPVGKAPFPKVRVIRVQTPDGLPSVPEDFSVHSGLDEVSMQVNWGPPLVSNGTLIGYEIRYQRTDVKKPPESPLTIYDANKTETYIYQLVERASYSVWDVIVDNQNAVLEQASITMDIDEERSLTDDEITVGEDFLHKVESFPAVTGSDSEVLHLNLRMLRSYQPL